MTAAGVLLGNGGLTMFCYAVIAFLHIPDRPYPDRPPEVVLMAVRMLLSFRLSRAAARSRSAGGHQSGVGGGWLLIADAAVLLIGGSGLPGRVHSDFPVLDTHLASILLSEAGGYLTAGVTVLGLMYRPSARRNHFGW